MFMSQACKQCGNRHARINHGDGYLYCVQCESRLQMPSKTDKIMEQMERLSQMIEMLTDVVRPFVRQNTDPEELSEWEDYLLWGDDCDDCENCKGCSEEDEEDKEEGADKEEDKPSRPGAN